MNANGKPQPVGKLENLLNDWRAYHMLGDWISKSQREYVAGAMSEAAFVLTWQGWENIRNRWDGPLDKYLADARAEIAAISQK